MLLPRAWPFGRECAAKANVVLLERPPASWLGPATREALRNRSGCGAVEPASCNKSRQARRCVCRARAHAVSLLVGAVPSAVTMAYNAEEELNKIKKLPGQ
jgi:hypothetical protein